MKRVVAIGELLIDFVPEEKGCALREVSHFERVAGGAPANVVTAVSRLGGAGVMVSQVGEDAFGEHIIEVLKKNGVDTTWVYRTKRANTGLAFVSLDATGNREFSFFRNPSADLFLSPEQITSELMENGAVLHFCSVDLVDHPVKQAHKRAIEMARERGMLVCFDPNVRLPLWESPEACQKAIREFLPCADIIKLSDDELEFVTGCSTVEEAAKQLFAMNCRLLLLTKGGDGSAAYTPSASAEREALRVPVADTTGCGDSFIGSFLYQLVRDEASMETLSALSEAKLGEYLDFSARYASLTVQHKGAVMATLEELMNAYPELK